MAPKRRYTPGYDCTAEDYLLQLTSHDVGFGVLVQPSFLGTDNSYMMAALDRYPTRLRGIAVVSADVSDTKLEEMNAGGVVGIRFNMIGRDIAEIASAEVAGLLKRVDFFGWQVEIQAQAHDLPEIFSHLRYFQGPVVIDHFGLPNPRLGVRDPGFRALLAEGSNGRTFVKLSAGYRCGDMDIATCAGALLAVLGPRRLIWGSDWPFTQFETTRSYGAMVSSLRQWIPDRETRDTLDNTAMTLFKFL
jgi:predicted TIM-barrel fold metal-dependent hydrolase